MVFRQNHKADAAYAIIAGPGRIRVGVPGQETKRLLVEGLHQGDVFGEIGVIENAPRTADAYADGPVRLLRIPAAAVLAALASPPRLDLNLSRLLAARLRRTFTLFQDASFETVEVRLARHVLYLAERGARRTERGIRIPGQLRQPDLADLLGTTTRSLITVLNAWRARNLVAYDGDKAARNLVAYDGDKTLLIILRRPRPPSPPLGRTRARPDLMNNVARKPESPLVFPPPFMGGAAGVRRTQGRHSKTRPAPQLRRRHRANLPIANACARSHRNSTALKPKNPRPRNAAVAPATSRRNASIAAAVPSRCAAICGPASSCIRQLPSLTRRALSAASISPAATWRSSSAMAASCAGQTPSSSRQSCFAAGTVASS